MAEAERDGNHAGRGRWLAVSGIGASSYLDCECAPAKDPTGSTIARVLGVKACFIASIRASVT